MGSHFIWRSNPEEVEREMNAFLNALEPASAE